MHVGVSFIQYAYDFVYTNKVLYTNSPIDFTSDIGIILRDILINNMKTNLHIIETNIQFI